MLKLILTILFIVLCFALLITHAIMLGLEWRDQRERRRQERREQEGKSTEGGPRALTSDDVLGKGEM